MVYAKRAEIHPLPFTKKVKKKTPKTPTHKPKNQDFRASPRVLDAKCNQIHKYYVWYIY